MTSRSARGRPSPTSAICWTSRSSSSMAWGETQTVEMLGKMLIWGQGWGIGKLTFVWQSSNIHWWVWPWDFSCMCGYLLSCACVFSLIILAFPSPSFTLSFPFMARFYLVVSVSWCFSPLHVFYGSLTPLVGTVTLGRILFYDIRLGYFGNLTWGVRVCVCVGGGCIMLRCQVWFCAYRDWLDESLKSCCFILVAWLGLVSVCGDECESICYCWRPCVSKRRLVILLINPLKKLKCFSENADVQQEKKLKENLS